MNYRVAIITGAGRGLGRAYARAFAERGDRVVVADIDLDSAGAVRDDIRQAGGEAMAIHLDVADPDSVDAAVELVEDEFGSPTVLINNAAKFANLQMRPFGEISLDEWNSVLSVNVTGAFLCTRAFAPAMIEKRHGKIVNVSSSTVWIGRPGYLHYVTSKSALIGMTRALASELGPHGVMVNAFTPGATRTEVERSTMSEQRWAEVATQTALGRYGTPEDMVGVVLFLASPESDFMTGQVMNIDGGRSFR